MSSVDALDPPDPFPVQLATRPTSPLITVTGRLIANILGTWAFHRSSRRLLARYIQWAVWERRADLLGQVTVDELTSVWTSLELSDFETDVLTCLLDKTA